LCPSQVLLTRKPRHPDRSENREGQATGKSCLTLSHGVDLMGILSDSLPPSNETTPPPPVDLVTRIRTCGPTPAVIAQSATDQERADRISGPRPRRRPQPRTADVLPWNPSLLAPSKRAAKPIPQHIADTEALAFRLVALYLQKPEFAIAIVQIAKAAAGGAS